jgi:hypothetical protein
MSPHDRAELECRVRSPSLPAGLVMRVRVVPAADCAGAGDTVYRWSTGRVSAHPPSKRMPSERLRMAPRRHKTEGPYVDPNPLGALRRSRRAFYRLRPRLILRLGARTPTMSASPKPSSTDTIATGGTHPTG